MTRTTSLSSFGGEYEQAILRAVEGLKSADEYAIQFEAPNIATSMRGRFYAFFKAVRASKDRPDLAGLITGISIRIAGSAMVFFRDEDALDRVRLRNALGLVDGWDDAGASTGVIAPVSGQTDALDRLRAIRDRKSGS